MCVKRIYRLNLYITICTHRYANLTENHIQQCSMKRENYVLRQQNHATYMSLIINIDKDKSLEPMQKETQQNKFAKHYAFLDFVW